MAWELGQTIDSVEALVRWAAQVSGGTFGGTLFRGQARSAWGLQPSLLRALPEDYRDKADIFERVGTMVFRKRAHAYIDRAALPDFGSAGDYASLNLGVLWAVMRHYGAPTRTLDWSFSPYIAAYFAVRDEWGSDGAIWHYSAHELRRAWTDAGFAPNDFAFVGGNFGREVVRHSGVPIFLDYEVTEETARMFAQQCRFTVCTDPTLSHDEALELVAKTDERRGWFAKAIVPACKKPALFRHLYAMGIRAPALFPGADGLGRSVEETYKLRAEDIRLLLQQKVDRIQDVVQRFRESSADG